jgi:hypothetical protein
VLTWVEAETERGGDVGESRRDWRCRVGWHAWVRRRNDPFAATAAAFYLQCRRCEKVRPLIDDHAGPYPIQDPDYGAM